MMKVRKKPVAVEAVQLNNEYHSICEAIEFVEGFDMSVSDIETKACVNTVMIHGGIFIKTLEGNMKDSFGDYIIKGIHGEFYPCKPNIFLETYDILEE